MTFRPATRGYAVKTIYLTLQCEGVHSGRPAVFLRFSGCNLWSGREADRPNAICQFCDTDFWKTDGENGGVYNSPEELATAAKRLWPGGGAPFIVCTGGEPMLQLDEPLISQLQHAGFEIAVETNGTKRVPESVDWICVSPKAGAPLLQESGDELKLVYPQPGAAPERFAQLAFDYFFLQPMDSPEYMKNRKAAVQYCLDHPQWRLSLQNHKLLGID